jgi:MYXO-CTERM domain-containing protein
VGTKVERQDPGFAANDVPPLGATNAQVDPQITGPLVERFPWTDEQIATGAITVSDMLAYFRTVYGPRAGSPLIDTGDPQDGNGADIGAIGAGKAHPDDRFGKLAKTSTPTEAGIASSNGHSSDGPFTLRCSVSSPGRSHDLPTGGWLVLGIASLPLRYRRRERSSRCSNDGTGEKPTS